MRAVPLSTPIDVSLRRARHASWHRWLREPLLHFVLLGALIFTLAHVIEEAKVASQTRVIVDSALRQRLANLHQAQFGVLPTTPQLDTIVESYVDDEVLYREAVALGLDQDDEIIRRRLIQKLEFLQRDASDPSEANTGVPDAAVRAYYDLHREQFSEPARVSFTHWYFSPDRGEADAFDRASRARSALLATGHPLATDEFPLASTYEAISRDDATRVFGTSPIVEALFTQRAGVWSQPVRSGFGWHLFNTSVLAAARVMPYDEVAPDVRAAYLQDLAARTKRRQLDALRGRYHVEHTVQNGGEVQ